MPPLARTFVKLSFAYLITGFLLGALMMLDRWLGFSRWLKVVYLSQLHLLVVGWLSQLAIGVAYWIFPRLLKQQDARPRGSDKLAWSVLVCLNVGLVLRFLLEPFQLLGAEPWVAAVVAFAGLLQAVAALGFGLLIWGRIRTMEP